MLRTTGTRRCRVRTEERPRPPEYRAAEERGHADVRVLVSVTLIIESGEAGRGAIHITANVEVSTLLADVFAHTIDGLIDLFAFGVFAGRFARRENTYHLFLAGRSWPRQDSEC